MSARSNGSRRRWPLVTLVALAVATAPGRALAGADQGATGAGVLVAILDAPDPDHPALAGQIEPGINIPALSVGENVTGTANPTTHGTAVAGAVLGVAPDARILPVDPDDPAVDGDGAIEDVADGIRWAVDHDADVIVVSLATPERTSYMEEAVDYAADHGVVVVAGAGNTEDRTPACDAFFGPDTDAGDAQYPASYDDVLSVGGTDSSGGAWACSQRDDVDTWAPAVDLELPVLGGRTGTVSGTSYAAPQIGGLAAIALQANPDLTPAELTAILTTRASLIDGRDPTDVEIAAQHIIVQHSFDQLQAEAGDGCGPGTFSPEQRTLGLTYAHGVTTLRIDAATLDVNEEGRVVLSTQIDDLTIYNAAGQGDDTISISWDYWIGTSADPADYDITWETVQTDESSLAGGAQLVLSHLDGPVLGLLGRANSAGYNIGDPQASSTSGNQDCFSERLGVSGFMSETDKQIDNYDFCEAGDFFLVAAPASTSPATASDLGWFTSGSFPELEVTTEAADACAPDAEPAAGEAAAGQPSEDGDLDSPGGASGTFLAAPVAIGIVVLSGGAAAVLRAGRAR
jgi:hypothetical protein